jgi:hypothetical protein
MALEMVRENFYGLMATIMKVISKMATLMDKDRIIMETANGIMVG